MEETRWDAWISKHPKLDKLEMSFWVARARFKRAINIPARIGDWNFKRQFKPGCFYLDHGDSPMVMIDYWECDKSQIRGLSMIDGLIRHCDVFACGPELTTEENAKALAKALREEKEKTS